MFECRACVLRYIRAIAGDIPASHALLRREAVLTPRLPLARYASTAVATNNVANNGLVPGKQPIEPRSDNDASQGAKKNGKKELAIRDKRHLELELKYLSDRVKLAEHVHYTLRNNDPEKALNLCRLASKHQEVIVAWNHVVDWYMQRNKIDDAITVYNEMKKRAQFPDSYTYVLLLRGLAKSHHHGQPVKESNVAKAMNIYNSMFSPNSRVKPSIYHTNAVIRVCSAAFDMDSLWAVAAKIPEKGHGKADHVTYTTLIDAIRHGCYGREAAPAGAADSAGVTVAPEQLTKRRDQAVQEGRRLWQEVIAKWRDGEVMIDEALVCAMGRLLLISRRLRDWDDVLNLVRQTMKIERLLPALGDPERKIEHVPQANDPEAGIHTEPEPEEDSEGYSDAPSSLAFKMVQALPPDPAHPHRPRSLAWVQPGNPTLSLLIDACTVLRSPKTASAYWDLLTKEYEVTPDLANFQAELKLLRINRSSARAAKILSEDMLAAGLRPRNQTFRLAMAVCMRDKNNVNVLDNARVVIDVMEKLSPDPDIHTLSEYLNLAMKTDDGEKIVAALDRVDPIIHNLRSRVAYGTEETGRMSPQQHLADKREIEHFFRTVVGVIDTLMNRGLVQRDDFREWHAKRSMLTQVIGRARVGNERLQARIERDKEAPAFTKPAREKSPSFQMSKGDWALRTFRYKGRREREKEESRLGAQTLKDWKQGARERSVRQWNGWSNVKHERLRGVEQGREGPGFADSPMELSGRE